MQAEPIQPTPPPQPWRWESIIIISCRWPRTLLRGSHHYRRKATGPCGRLPSWGVRTSLTTIATAVRTACSLNISTEQMIAMEDSNRLHQPNHGRSPVSRLAWASIPRRTLFGLEDGVSKERAFSRESKHSLQTFSVE